MRRLVAATAAALVLVCAAPAAAQTVSCGQTLTADTTLQADLVDCPGNGLVIGADGITLDLNGHTLDGLTGEGACVPDCLHGRGIDNTAGHDDVRILNGTITGFERGVILVGAERNVLRRLSVHASARAEVFSPVTLIRSDRNVVADSSMGTGEPALLLLLSHHNRIVRSSMFGGITIRQGNGVAIVEGDRNTLLDDRVGGDGFGAWIEASLGNRLVRGTVGGYHGNLLRGVSQTEIVGTSLEGRGGTLVEGDLNLIARNAVVAEQGLAVIGNLNRVLRNVKTGGQFGISVDGGQGAVVAWNRVEGVLNGITVGPYATDARVVSNTTNANHSRGIWVQAAGTRVGRNSADDNDGLGIDAVPGAIDAGGNRATGNGNPLQCVNVFCG